ncbi:hypothetical protein BOTBODRAFT_193024 [Botryobasidium botryosum FD-172 SS1]|uniref:Uncharacterized protein n=1 Tax=Botryobasidium botryosum (strain FD-172 SS1) TaxID=930990 RepID=A0A067M4H3_BOTB1|nr:hypothetical protein BOTBODRAFT_193024 [Botryobasidium botryosum FD-172 SS1]
MSYSDDTIDRYKVPRASVDVEALAQQQARYLRIHAEEAQILAADPTARDKALAELNSSSKVKGGGVLAASVLVPYGDEPDEYLNRVDAELEKVPVTVQERMSRLNYAFSALVVFYEYKIRYALPDHPDLMTQVRLRTIQIHNEWRGDFVRRFNLQIPPKAKAKAKARVRPAPPRLPPSSTKIINTVEVEDLLKDPKLLLNMQFTCVADSATWVTDSFTQSKEGIEYSIKFDDRSEPYSMDEQGMRILLEESRVNV